MFAASKKKDTTTTYGNTSNNTSSSSADIPKQTGAGKGDENIVKASANSIGINSSAKGSVVGRGGGRLATAASKPLPPRMMKGASQLSLNTKQKIRAKPQEYAYSATASFQEITRLISLNDEQKQFIIKLQSEIKTLKIVNARQEKGLQTIDKYQDEFPKLFKNMNEELRVARTDRQKAMEKVMKLEKQALSAATGYHNQQLKIKELKGKLKKNTNPDFEALQKELSEKTKELEVCHTMIEELNSQIKTVTGERNREINFAKQKYAKLTKELEDAKNETIRLTNSLKEKERTVNTLSMYSRRSNMSETEDEGTNASHRGKTKKMHKEKLRPMSDDADGSDFPGAEAAPVVPVSLAVAEFPAARNHSARSRSQSAKPIGVPEIELRDTTLLTVAAAANTQKESVSHQRVASYPFTADLSRQGTPSASLQQQTTKEVDIGVHQRVASYSFSGEISRGTTPAKPAETPVKTAAAQDISKSAFSFFKPNFKAKSVKSVASEAPALSDAEYSDDFHHDEMEKKVI